MENRTNMEHREQNKFGTWRTEQIWNMENRTNMEHGKQNEVESRKILEQVQGRSGQLNY